jgi:dUTP pyrophosphatase
MIMPLRFKKLHNDAKIPNYAYPSDSGMDITSVVDGVIPSKGFMLFETGLAVEIPEGYEIQMRAKSGLAAKHGVFILNGIGTIDQNFRGELKAILANFSDKPYEVKKGDKVAQLVLGKVHHAEIEETPELFNTDRGSNGFGSTGR